MMRKLTARLMREAADGHAEASRRSAVDYALMDAAERARLNVRPPPEERHLCTVRAPVPWHQGVVVARQFCRHNLFVTNPILLRMQVVWSRRYSHLRFVDPERLVGHRGEPLSPTVMQRRVFEQCDDARNILKKVILWQNWI